MNAGSIVLEGIGFPSRFCVCEEMNDLKELQVLEGHYGTVWGVAWSPKGEEMGFPIYLRLPVPVFGNVNGSRSCCDGQIWQKLEWAGYSD